jgi:hypothetical protein
LQRNPRNLICRSHKFQHIYFVWKPGPRMRHFIDKLHTAVMDVKWTEGGEVNSTGLLARTPEGREREFHNSDDRVRRGGCRHPRHL